MNCNEFRDHLMDLVTSNEGPAEARAHADGCGNCAAELASFRQTMAMLDEWAAPADTSPYFMTRLRARMREEEQAPARGWMSWFRRPAFAVALMVLMVLSVTVYRTGVRTTQAPPVATVPGTAVGDLSNLDKNHDMLADFELLDDLEHGTAQ
jgi:anti-sigma factor RsiW